MVTEKAGPVSPAISPGTGDRRCEIREPLDQRVTVTSLPNMEVSFVGRLTDSSFSGLGLAVPWPLKEAAWIAVEWDAVFALGWIVYCKEEDSEYHAGIRTSYIIHDRTGSHMRPYSMKAQLSRILFV
jgi:hypothetical protein